MYNKLKQWLLHPIRSWRHRNVYTIHVERDKHYFIQPEAMLNHNSKVLTDIGYINAAGIDIGDTVITDRGPANVMAIWGKTSDEWPEYIETGDTID